MNEFKWSGQVPEDNNVGLLILGGIIIGTILLSLGVILL